jgi:hypothetical protein
VQGFETLGGGLDFFGQMALFRFQSLYPIAQLRILSVKRLQTRQHIAETTLKGVKQIRSRFHALKFGRKLPIGQGASEVNASEFEGVAVLVTGCVAE